MRFGGEGQGEGKGGEGEGMGGKGIGVEGLLNFLLIFHATWAEPGNPS